MLTPLILMVTSVAFFGFFFFKGGLEDFALQAFGMSSLAMTVFLGSSQNVLSRVAKYTIFDTTQQVAYVPLGAESKTKGKAAIDGIGSRLGKTTGSVIYQSLLIAFSSITASAPYVVGFIFSTIAIWMASVGWLGRRFNQLTQAPKKTYTEVSST
jgi:AAA family ATP:ADP antiporter